MILPLLDVLLTPTNHKVAEQLLEGLPYQDIGKVLDTSANVVSYNVYRTFTSGGYYGLVGSTAALIYTDSDVQSGVTYYYCVTAVDDQGRESARSNEARASVP
jgi:fibronectin type 3 domain-containing protein